MSAPTFGMVGVIFPDRVSSPELETALHGVFRATPLTQLTVWRAPGVFAVTAQHAYETDGVPGRNERAIPEAGGTLGLVCADLTMRDTMSVEQASKLVAAIPGDDHSDLKQLDGSWVGFAWNPATRKARFFRDAAGLRLLFVAVLADRIVFATDVRLLVAAGVPRVLDQQAAAEYMHFFYISGPRILLRDARAVLPAHVMTADAAGVRQARWVPGRWVPGKPLGDAQAIERAVEAELPNFEARLLEAVRACIPPRGRVALSLSGGKDSSTLAVALSKICPERTLAFTVGMTDQRYDEGNDAALVCKALGIEHFKHVASDQELASGIREFTAAQDQPVGDLAALPYYLAMKALPEDCGVLLDGSGNDYYFGCNIAWKLTRLQQRLRIQRSMPGPLWKTLLWGMSHTSNRMRLLADTWRKPVEEAFCGWEGWTADELTKLFGRDVDFEDSYWWRTVRTLDLARPTDLQTEAICHVWEPSTAFRKAVHFGQSTGRVVRLPFTDVRLCTYVQSLPAELKYNGKVNKWILRAYMKANLPREIVEKPKHGFIFDLNRAIANPAYDWAADMAGSSRLRYSPEWSQPEIDKLLKAYRDFPSDMHLQQRVYSLCQINSAFASPNAGGEPFVTRAP